MYAVSTAHDSATLAGNVESCIRFFCRRRKKPGIGPSIAGLILIAVWRSGLAASPVGEQPSGAQADQLLAFESRLDTYIPRFDNGGRSLIEGLLDLTYEYHLPMGLEYVDREAVNKRLDLRLSNTSVRHALGALAAEAPKYKISFSSGIVQVYSPKSRANPSNVLNTAISDFKVDGVDPYAADRRLFGALSAKLYPGRGYGGSTPIGALGEKRITLPLQNARVYQIVSAIVAEHGEGVWVVKVPPDQLSAFGGTLWHIYGLDPIFKSVIIRDLRALFPPEK